MILTKVIKKKFNKDPFVDSLDMVKFRSFLETEYFDMDDQAIDFSPEKVVKLSVTELGNISEEVTKNRNPVAVESQSKVFNKLSEAKIPVDLNQKSISKKTLIAKPIFRSVKPVIQPDLETIEAEILSKIKLSTISNWSLWLDLAVMYCKYEQFDNAKQTYSFVAKNAKGLSKETAKIKLMEIF
jgi:hypothetical protein